MAISTADFKNGMCIMYNNKMCTIIEFQHVKLARAVRSFA